MKGTLWAGAIGVSGATVVRFERKPGRCDRRIAWQRCMYRSTTRIDLVGAMPPVAVWRGGRLRETMSAADVDAVARAGEIAVRGSPSVAPRPGRPGPVPRFAVGRSAHRSAGHT